MSESRGNDSRILYGEHTGGIREAYGKDSRKYKVGRLEGRNNVRHSLDDRQIPLED